MITLLLPAIAKPLEKYLSRRTNELFDLNDNIILYDLTNTYYEGTRRKSKIARFSRSKEKRSDAWLVVLAVVVNQEGFRKYSEVFEGNMTDSGTPGRITEDLSVRIFSIERRPIVVLDAGIATEDNLKLLRENHFQYICESRSALDKYTANKESKPI